VSSVEAAKINKKVVKITPKWDYIEQDYDIKYYKRYEKNFKVGKTDSLNVHYQSRNLKGLQSRKKLAIFLYRTNNPFDGNPKHKLTKSTIYFKKTVNGRTVYSTKTFKNKYWIYYNPKNNFEPYKGVFYYTKK